MDYRNYLPAASETITPLVAEGVKLRQYSCWVAPDAPLLYGMGQSTSKIPKLISLRYRGRMKSSSDDSDPGTAVVSSSHDNVSPPLGDQSFSVNQATNGKNDSILSEQGGSIVEIFEGETANNYSLQIGVEKYGERISRSEAVAMELLQKYTDVPAPKLLDTFFSEGFGQLVMTFIPGRTLEAAWSEMNEQQKEAACQYLWTLIEKIRQTPQPPELAGLALCLADGSPSDDPLIKNFEDHMAPLTSDEDIRARIYERYYRYNGRKYEKVLGDMLPRSAKSVFTHADIAPRNIMVDDDFRIVGVLDWERAGWYPDYWELANITAPACYCGDWQDWMIKTAPRSFKCDLQGIDAARAVLF